MAKLDSKIKIELDKEQVETIKTFNNNSLSFRDKIAIEYMKDQLARGNDYLENISKQAYLMADAMMKERDKRN
jgi:hypothetical protein